MTNEEADELLRNNEWCKWSDARELLQEAAEIGAAKERARAESAEAERDRLKAELIASQCNLDHALRVEMMRTQVIRELEAERDRLRDALRTLLDTIDAAAKGKG
jgi:hypothetical protein